MEHASTFHLKEDGNHCLVLVKGKWKKKIKNKKHKWLHWLQAVRGGNTNTHQFYQLESHWLTATVMSSCIASSANYVQINISSAFPKETLLLGSTRLAEVWVSHHWISRYEEGMRTQRVRGHPFKTGFDTWVLLQLFWFFSNQVSEFVDNLLPTKDFWILQEKTTTRMHRSQDPFLSIKYS